MGERGGFAGDPFQLAVAFGGEEGVAGGHGVGGDKEKGAALDGDFGEDGGDVEIAERFDRDGAEGKAAEEADAEVVEAGYGFLEGVGVEDRGEFAEPADVDFL